MEQFKRFGIYYLPDGALAEFGAAWLGWDIDRGAPTPAPSPAGHWTDTPRKYGFHGTLKPPFRLAPGHTAQGLLEAAEALAEAHAPVVVDRLRLARLGYFFALVPEGDVVDLGAMASACVSQLDGFRAPATPAELDKRRAKGLSPRQDEMLLRWGYPYVMEEFRFHLTLSGRVPHGQRDEVETLITAHLPHLPEPFEIQGIGLVGERDDGQFETIARLPFGG